MNKVEIIITTPTQALKDVAEVWRRAQASDRDITPTIGFGSPSELFTAITDKRLELLRHVASHEELNIHQLAQALGRDYKNVHTDVSRLLELNLLEKNQDGQVNVPWQAVRAELKLGP